MATGAERTGWVDLLDDLAGQHVVLGEPDADLAGRLASAGAVVVPDGPDRGNADLVFLPSGRLRDAATVRARRALGRGGRVVVLAQNSRSPLRIQHAATGAAVATVRVGSLGELTRHLRRHGLHAHQVFGLLRSAAAPVAAVDLGAPAASSAVLAALSTHIGDIRAAGLWLLGTAPAAMAAQLYPAWLIIAGEERQAPRPDRITGRIGNRDSAEIKLVRGDPPAVLEKHYADISRADAEADALATLATRAPGLVPAPLGRPSPTVLQMSWLTGAPLAGQALAARNLVRWFERAAEVLTRLQRSTFQPRSGNVLVHGDFWLGNMMVADGDIVGVIDWTEARWGSPRVDQDFLVEATAATHPELARHLRACADRIFGRFAVPRSAGADDDR